MIQCSPQELIAQTLNNCFIQSHPRIRNMGTKPTDKKMSHKKPIRQSDKISLKAVSLNKPSNAGQESLPSTSRNQMIVGQITQRVAISTNYPVSLEKRYHQNVRFVEKCPVGLPITPNFTYGIPTQPHNEYLLVHSQKQIRTKPERDKLSQVDTNYSYATTQKQCSILHQTPNRDKQTNSKPNSHRDPSAEKNLRRAPFEGLNPKLTESVVNDSFRDQDQFSEVIMSYFPN